MARHTPVIQKKHPILCASPEEVVVGIDLGTTNSAIAYAENGKPVVVPSTEGHPFTPSVVSFREDGRLVIGLEAKKKAAMFPKTTFYSIKRFIGRR